MKRVLYLLFFFFPHLSKPLQFLTGDPIWELLAYSYASWPSWLHPRDCFCSALSWHFDRRLTLPPVTGKGCIVVINSWSLNISGCRLQISHYTGACDRLKLLTQMHFLSSQPSFLPSSLFEKAVRNLIQNKRTQRVLFYELSQRNQPLPTMKKGRRGGRNVREEESKFSVVNTMQYIHGVL